MSVTPEVLRAAVYLETMARVDAPFKPSGKTRRGVKCDPPNKKCGNRCIPPNWNCRITGGGLDSHSKAVQYDPVSGTNNLVRGVKNVIQGTQKADPELLTRGIKGVERGVVKLTPGQTKDEKERLKQKIQVIGTIAFTGILTGIAVHKTHGFFSNFKWYREGVGKKVEDAARTAVDNVMNTWDASVNRLGLGSMASGRAQITGNAMRTATLLGRQSRFREVTETRLTGSPRDSNFLANRALLRTSGIGGSNFINLQVIDAEARRGNWTRAQWEARKVEALYSQRTKPNSGVGDPGVSVFAAPAAHEYLAAQWGFKMPDKRVNRESTTLAEGEVIKGLLRTSVRDMHSSLVSDMERRGVPRTTDGIRQYTEQLLRENPSLIPRSLSTRDQRRLNTQFRQNISNILELRTYQQQNKYASDLYRNTVTMYDSYFTSMASTLETDRQTRRYITHPTKLESAAGVAEHGLARYHAAGRGPSIRPRDRTGASFLNGYYFDQVVRKNRGLYEIPDTKKAIQYANSLANRPIRTLAEAEAWYRENNLKVRIPRPRRLFQTDAVPRIDYTPPNKRLGKPCGGSFIPKNATCHKKLSSGYAKETPEPAKPDTNSTAKTLGRAALSIGLAAGTALAAKALWDNRKEVTGFLQHSVVTGLSSAQVEEGLNRLPGFLRSKARSLVGSAKYATAYMSLKARGFTMVDVSTKDNFATFKDRTGTLVSVGTVGNNLLTFNSVNQPKRVQLADGRRIDLVGVQFFVDDSFNQKKNLSTAATTEFTAKTKSMFNNHLKHGSNNHIMYAVPFNDDGKGAARTAAYSRWGFTPLSGLDAIPPWNSFKGNVVFALKSDGKIVKMNDDYKHYISNVLATADGQKFNPDRVSRQAATAKTSNQTYKPPKTVTNSGSKSSVDVKLPSRAGKPGWAALPKNNAYQVLDERHRERTYKEIVKAKPITATELASRFDDIKKHAGVEPENIDRLSAFVRNSNVTIEHDVFEKAVQAAPTLNETLGWIQVKEQIARGYSVSGMYFTEQSPELVRHKVFVSPKRKTLDSWEDASLDAVNTVNEFMDNVAKHNVSTILKGPPIADKSAFIYYTTYNAATNGDAHDLIAATHETGHAIHESVKFRKFNLTPDTEVQLARVTSAYGLSDFNDSQRETFAELFVLYSFAGKRLRKEAPTLYDWVDSVVGEA